MKRRKTRNAHNDLLHRQQRIIKHRPRPVNHRRHRLNIHLIHPLRRKPRQIHRHPCRSLYALTRRADGVLRVRNEGREGGEEEGEGDEEEEEGEEGLGEPEEGEVSAGTEERI